MQSLENSHLLKQLRKLAEGDLTEVSEEFSVPEQVLKTVRNSNREEIISKNYPYDMKIKRSAYEQEKKILQIEMVKLQNWVKKTGSKIIMVFEGRDAAGKGGAIKRFTEHMNPRGARVVALNKPTQTEQGQWYFQRYINHFPTEGEIVLFDRSWYNRAGVERVMGFCTDEEYNTFFNQVTEFEKMIINSGVHLFKFWFSVSREEQIRRFIARSTDPLKQWKLSPMDVASLGTWHAYTEAKRIMFERTDIDESPWVIVKSDDKKRSRLNAMKHVLNALEYENKNEDIIKSVDRNLLGRYKDFSNQKE